MTGIETVLMWMALVAVPVWWVWQRKRAARFNEWPLTDATIESGSMEVVAAERGVTVTLPVFAFSYSVAGEFYSGRFALMPYITDPAPGITDRMIGRKLRVHYDPQKPNRWYIPDALIEGCKIEQKLAPHVLCFHPRD